MDDTKRQPAVGDDDDPRAMLELISAQQKRVDRALIAPVPWLYGIWGAAWLLGFLALWSAYPGGNPWFEIPMTIAAPVFVVLLVGSIVASGIIGSRINRGVRGGSSFSGAVYGISWSLCGIAFAGLGMGLIANGMSTELAGIFFPAAYALMCGTLYLAGAALWRDTVQLVIGVALLALGALSPFAGSPGNNLVMAVFGGGAFLAGAVATAVLNRR